MTISLAETGWHPRLLQSTAAVLLGLFTVLVLSLVTDQVLQLPDVHLPGGQLMRSPLLKVLALSYRCAYAVAGSYIAAKFAPCNPSAHALAAGGTRACSA
jgi:hypothetical protein